MGRIPRSAPREHVEPDQYPAICVGFYDLGTHETSYKGKKKLTHLCRVSFELDDLEMENGDPFIYDKTYTFSASPKSRFMKDLKSWLGVKDGDFDPDEMLGEPALINLVENEGSDGNVYMNIDSVTKLPKKMKVGDPVTEPLSIYLDDTFDEEVYDQLPEWIQNKIAESPEYEELMEGTSKKKASKTKSKRRDEEEEEEEEDDRPKRKSGKSKRKARDDDDDDDDDDDEDDKKSRKRKSRRDEEEEEEEDENEEEEDEEEEDEKQKRKSSSKSKRKSRDDDDEEEEEEEEEDEDERPTRKRNAPARRESSSKKKPANAPARGKTFRPTKKK